MGKIIGIDLGTTNSVVAIMIGREPKVILSVTAKDTATGKDQKITITASSGLTESEIQKMVKEASEHEADDKARREQVERRNKLDNLCYTLEKTLRENEGKVPAEVRASLDSLIGEGRQAVESQDDDAIKSVSEP